MLISDPRAVFEALSSTTLSQSLQASRYAVAAGEMFHLLSLALLGGVLLLNNGRALWPLLGPAPAIRGLYRFALLAICASGLFIMAAEPLKCFEHPAFRLKMLALATGLLLQPYLSRCIETNPLSMRAKSAALTSLALWSTIGFLGRAIGFY